MTIARSPRGGALAPIPGAPDPRPPAGAARGMGAGRRSRPRAVAARAAPPASRPGVPRGVLVATCAFSARLQAERVAEAIAGGLRAGGLQTVDLLPLPAGAARAAEAPPRGAQLDALLAAEGFDERMRAARALVIAERRLAEPALARSVTFELATRARQAGVPAYAVAAEARLGAFDARMLDLQEVLAATGAPALQRAGRRLAALLAPPR
jgi:hypothetical protein